MNPVVKSDAAKRTTLVFEPIAIWAAKTPAKMAIASEEGQWTYRLLEDQTNQIAHALHARGVKAGDRVAFVLPRGPQAVLLLIAILKAGAAYVPIDSQSPPGRIADCLEDADPTLVVTSDKMARLIGTPALILTIDEILKEAEGCYPAPLDVAAQGSDLAYIIFTSGTTGRPKGVPITHASLSNFVEGDQLDCIQVEPNDKVFQGFSPASDGHHEEVWPTFLAGATLVVASPAQVHSGPELGAFLRDNKVTIISCAPTLLSMVDGDVPTLRRILFGAENLPVSMIDRWWQVGREILNTYGPTEATVGATFGVCAPGKAVTIGRPLPGYYCYVLNENLDEVPEGQEGELAIAGVGVSNGYFRREELSLGKFVTNPKGSASLRNEILYRTGDRVKLNAEGNLVWLGRVDNQVKVRGHRIELSEIESHVLSDPAVQSAVVVAREDDKGETHLAALVLLKEHVDLDFSEFLERMRDAMPSYMIPQAVELVEAIPMLPSGKIDRGACAKLHGHPLRVEREIMPPSNETEAMILGVWKELFKTGDISCGDDFFLDLGGYSLMASRVVSALRSDHGYTTVSVLDLYENPTIRSLAAILDGKTRPQEKEIPFAVPSPKQYTRAKVIQVAGVLVLFGLQALTWLGPILAAIYLSNEANLKDYQALILALILHAVSVPLLFWFAIVVKWGVGGRFQEGDYPIWGAVFLRWWFVDRVLTMAPVNFILGTPLAASYLRALGAKVGQNVNLESLEFNCADQIEIGNDCSFENSSWVRASEVSGGYLKIRKIKVGNGCLIGVRSGVSGGGVLEDGVALRDMTCVTSGLTVPAGEEWFGTPARRADERHLPLYNAAEQPSKARLRTFAAAQALLVGLLAFIESIPFVVLAFTLYNQSDEGPLIYALEPVFAVGIVALACVQTLVVKWAVLGKLREGTFPYPGVYALRKWFTDRHLDLVSGMIVPVYDSLFTRPWCQLLGMKCGPRCEIALPRRMPYDLVEMGEESFLASEVSIGMPVRRNGKLTLEKTVVGNRVFLGNDSVVPQGCHITDESLLGVLSSAPTAKQMGSEPGQVWLGSPAFQMQTRQVDTTFALHQTYRPLKRLYIERLLHEAFRIALPSVFSLMIASAFFEVFTWIWNQSDRLWAGHESFWVPLLCVPFLYCIAALIALVICRLAKRILVGKYEPSVNPLWSRRVWNVETYSAVLHDFGVPIFMLPLVGTPMMAGVMRFLGAKVGHRAFIDTTDWTETDLITIGDDVAINSNAPLQAHLFEDRIMKMGPIKIGDRCSVGNYSVILCESELKKDSHIGHLSLVMKGETIPSHTYWVGSPAQIDVVATNA